MGTAPRPPWDSRAPVRLDYWLFHHSLISPCRNQVEQALDCPREWNTPLPDAQTFISRRTSAFTRATTELTCASYLRVRLVCLIGALYYPFNIINATRATATMPPQIIVLNGASNADKSSLALALQQRLHPDFLHMPIDTFAGMLPESAQAHCIRELAEHRGLPLVRGFHAAVAAMVKARYHVIVGHLYATNGFRTPSTPSAAFPWPTSACIANCPSCWNASGNERQSRSYPDIAERRPGSIHGGCIYDLEVDGTRENTKADADRVAAWLATAPEPDAFERMRARLQPAKSAKASPGCFQLYTGNGKGKTTAATGLAVRALGAGYRVFIGQFMKHDTSSEMRALQGHFPGVTVEFFGIRWMIGKPAKAGRPRSGAAWTDTAD